jgi:RNA polymerase sigma-70 factor (ECF subfamily)
MTEAEDPDLADRRRVLDGDLNAFTGIVQRWQGRLVTLAWRFCRDRALAEDMAQDAFVKAFRALPTFRGDAAFSTWLTSIALNSYRSAIRAHDPRPTALTLLTLDTGEPGPLASLVRQERASLVREMVMTLPPRYREPIVLYYFNEQDLATTAALLGLPEGTVKARLHRGREFLRRRLAAAKLVGDAASQGDR